MGEVKTVKAFKQMVMYYECPYCEEINEHNEYEVDHCTFCGKEVNVEV